MACFVRLVLTLPILAVTEHSSDHRFVEIPTGSLIETPDDLAEPGLRPVRFDGVELLAFARDIRERTREPNSVM
jgi:hypothetical protein